MRNQPSRLGRWVRWSLSHFIREFELAEELGANQTADAYRVKYSGDGDTCASADFTANTDDTFKVGGGAMSALRLTTFAAGTRGLCVKIPGRRWWTIFQIDCNPQEGS
jgi:hypothetical protein